MKINNYDFPLDMQSENSLSLIIEQIEPKSIVLEFGPAAGRMTKYLSEQLACSVYIVELDEVAYEKSNKYAVDGICGDIENFLWEEKFREIKFDYVVFADVLEHLSNPEIVLEKASRMLSEKGRVIASVPNIAHNYIIFDLINNRFNYSDRGILDETHLKFFTYYSFLQLFSDADLKVIVEKTVTQECEDKIIENISDSESAYKYNLLDNREFANVFQFVFTAIPQQAYLTQIDEMAIQKCNNASSDGVALIQSIFIDDGHGFREEFKIAKRLNLISNKFHFSADLSEVKTIKSLRFDPCEYACRVKIHEIKGNISVGIESVNSTSKEDGYDVFMHADPVFQIFCDSYEELQGIEITGEILRINTYDMFRYYSERIDVSNKKIEEVYLQNENEIKKNQELSERIVSLKSKLETLTTSLDQVIEYNNLLKIEIENKSIIIENCESEIEKEKIKNKQYVLELESQKQENIQNIQIINTLQENSENYSAEIEKLKLMHLKSQDEMKHLEWQISMQERKVLKLEKMNEISNKQLLQLQNTKLWKLAKPIRKAIHISKKIKRKLDVKYDSLKEKELVLTDKIIDANSYYDIKISVVVPTYNAHAYMTELLDTLKKQKGIREIEIIIVDSESSDDTVKICSAFDVHLIHISQQEFSHSYARNLGAEKATGDLLIFMTQDALPSNEYWLYNMATPLMKHGISAASCIEIHREDCEMAYRIESTYFADYLGILKSDKIGTLPKEVNFETLRKNGQLNDVSCIIYKNIFDQFGYSGDYAEDLDLGIKLIKSGHKIGLLSSEGVIHSHNRSVLYYFKRSLVDTKNLLKILPDYPVYEQSTDNLIDAVLLAYYKIVCILDQIQYNLSTPCTVNEMYSMIGESINSLVPITEVGFEKFQFDKMYSDKKIDDFIQKLTEIVEYNTAQSSYIYNHLIHYITNNMKAFVSKNYTVIDSTIKEEIILTIYKRFVSVSGNEISLHLLTYNSNMKLGLLMEEFYKGV